MSDPGYLAHWAYQLMWSGLDWLFPPRCAGCGGNGSRFCDDCLAKIQPITGKVCQICGQPNPSKSLCSWCEEHKPSFTALRSWAPYSGALRQAILKLKYHRDVSLGEILSRPLIGLIKQLHWEVDLLVPVPVSLARFKERGYNQVSLIAFPLALGSDIPYRARALTKIRETRSQVGLAAEERHKNVAKAFTANPRMVEGRRVLVVDDITTTSATMEACAVELSRAGASAVFGITLARSLLE